MGIIPNSESHSIYPNQESHEPKDPPSPEQTDVDLTHLMPAHSLQSNLPAAIDSKIVTALPTNEKVAHQTTALSRQILKPSTPKVESSNKLLEILKAIKESEPKSLTDIDRTLKAIRLSPPPQITTLKQLMELTKALPPHQAYFRAEIIYRLSTHAELKTDENKDLMEEILPICAETDPFTAARYVGNFHLQSQDILTELYSACEKAAPANLKGVLRLYKKNFTPIPESDFRITDFNRFTLELNCSPLFPTRSNKLTADQMVNWIAKHPPEARETAKALLDAVEHVSMDTFAEKLANSISALEHVLSDSTPQECVFMAMAGKSNQWLTELALPLMSKDTLPSDVISTDYDAYLKKQYESTAPKFPSKIVLLDDGIYSGTQMSSILTLILRSTFLANCNHPDLNIPFPDIYVVPVYATASGIAFIEKSFPKDLVEILGFFLENPGLQDQHEAFINFCRKSSLNLLKGKLHILPSEKIQTLAEAISDKNMQARIDAMNFSLDHVGAEFGWNAQGVQTRGNVYFDFKIPDSLSFPASLGEGMILSTTGNILLEPPSTDPLIIATVPPYQPQYLSFLKTLQQENAQEM